MSPSHTGRRLRLIGTGHDVQQLIALFNGDPAADKYLDNNFDSMQHRLISLYHPRAGPDRIYPMYLEENPPIMFGIETQYYLP
jgi:hypothetical protein